MRIHAGTLGTLLREVARSPSGHDWVFVPGKKSSGTGRSSLYSTWMLDSVLAQVDLDGRFSSGTGRVFPMYGTWMLGSVLAQVGLDARLSSGTGRVLACFLRTVHGC